VSGNASYLIGKLQFLVGVISLPIPIFEPESPQSLNTDCHRGDSHDLNFYIQIVIVAKATTPYSQTKKIARAMLMYLFYTIFCLKCLMFFGSQGRKDAEIRMSS